MTEQMIQKSTRSKSSPYPANVTKGRQLHWVPRYDDSLHVVDDLRSAKGDVSPSVVRHETCYQMCVALDTLLSIEEIKTRLFTRSLMNRL